MATLAMMRTEVLATLGLNPGTGTQDYVQATNKLNEAVVDVVLNTRCYITASTMNTTAGEGDYTMDAAIMHIEYVTNEISGGNTYRLELVRPQDILEMRLSASSDRSPSRYFAVQGSDMFMLYPTPSAADVIKVYYTPHPTALSNPSDDPSSQTLGGIPAEFHRAVVLYALSHLADQDDDQSSGQGVRYQQDYERMLVRIRKHVSFKGGTTLPGFRLKRPRRFYAPHDPSTDGW